MSPIYKLKLPERSNVDGRSCKNCKFVSDFSDTEPPDEVNAYCCHPFHSTRQSEHYEYKGHWTHTDSICDMHELGVWLMPDFQQFADKLIGMIGTGTGNFVRSVYLSDLEQAERHARLLQQIWEMVEREKSASREALQREERRNDPSWKSIGHHQGQFLAFDAVRSLLVSQTEEK